MTAHPQVLEHLPTVVITTTVPEFQASLLALIHVESLGNPNAYRPGSRYFGLLQIADPYLQDAIEFSKGNQNLKARDLAGNAQLSIWATVAYMNRYQRFHNWNPRLIAIAHKGGAGTLRRFSEGKEDLTNSTIPNIAEYVRRFEAVYPVYLEFISNKNGQNQGEV